MRAPRDVPLGPTLYRIEPQTAHVTASPSPRHFTGMDANAEHPVRLWSLSITGKNQGPGRPTGMDALWLAKRELFWDEPRDVEVMDPLPWDTDWKAVAAWIKRMSAPDAVAVLDAYSWGAGWGLRRLAEELLAIEGPPIVIVTITDGVYRSPYLPTWLPLNPLSLVNSLPGITPHIPLPENVLEVHWYYQRVNKPQGHEPRRARGNKVTNIHPGIRVYGYGHSDMDEFAGFQRAALDACRLTLHNLRRVRQAESTKGQPR